MRYLLVLLTALLLAACADPYRNLYDGIQNNNDVKRSPNERAISPTPGYDEYKKEREDKTPD